MFDRSKCNLCGDCLVECMYNDYDRKSAIAERTALIEGRPTDIAKKCITCLSCNEVCEKGANPFGLIAEVQEKTNALEVPQEVISMMEHTFQESNEIRKGAPGKPAISSCIISKALPRPLEGPLFDDLTRIRGGDYFCNTAWIKVGRLSLFEKRIHSFIDNLAATGENEIVFLHDECYAAVTTLARRYGIRVPFRSIHIIEYLRDQMKSRNDEIKKLNLKIAYQRPCSSHYTSEKELMLDELFELIGVERVSRRYDRKDALCCGMPLMYRDVHRGMEIQQKIFDDVKETGAVAMIFLCPVCILSMGSGCTERGLDIYMISDLCRLALGEQI